MSEVIKTAVKLTNESNQGAVEREGLRLVNLILGERASVRQCEARIEEHRKALKEIADTSINIESVMGDMQPPSDGSPNTKTILAVIEKANAERQDAVKIASTNLVAEIDGEQRNIAATTKRIVELRQMLSKLAAESVTVHTVMDS